MSMSSGPASSGCASSCTASSLPSDRRGMADLSVLPARRILPASAPRRSRTRTRAPPPSQPSTSGPPCSTSRTASFSLSFSTNRDPGTSSSNNCLKGRARSSGANRLILIKKWPALRGGPFPTNNTLCSTKPSERRVRDSFWSWGATALRRRWIQAASTRSASPIIVFASESVLRKSTSSVLSKFLGSSKLLKLSSTVFCFSRWYVITCGAPVAASSSASFPASRVVLPACVDSSRASSSKSFSPPERPRCRRWAEWSPASKLQIL
mmetsp:Transcript_2127/g.4321  ORF Transcript_2127/g.4321 Transcript_2127/m.4321 type:complete len:266 (-) Transcript_2127:347-1144(-)